MGFEFKRFRIEDDKCGQKVCTDSILLGSWVDIKPGARVLDIGSGCGLLTIMLAQRCEGNIEAHGVELDKSAFEQSMDNAKSCPWTDAIEFHHVDINEFQYEKQSEKAFDLIISNPPYFNSSLKGPSDKRNQARHTDSLSFSQLLENVGRLLSKNGEFSVVLPTTGAKELELLATNYDLHLVKQLRVCTIMGKPAKLQLMSFARKQKFESDEFSGVVDGQLIIHDGKGDYSSQFIALTRNFYLNR